MSIFLYFCQIDFNIAISIIILSLIFLMVKGYEKMQDSKAIKECLDKLLSANDRVFIVPHNRPDMDAIGASIGMALICKKNKKRCFIVVDDDLEKIEISTRKIIEEINNDYEIIKASEGPIKTVDCDNNCTKKDTCISKKLWCDLDNTLNEFFDNKTLKDLL